MMQIRSLLRSKDDHHQIELTVLFGIGLLILWFISLMTFMENGDDHILNLAYVGAFSLSLLGLARIMPNAPSQGYWMAFAATLTAVGAYFRLNGFFPHTEIVFALSVIGITARWGSKPGLLAGVLAALSNGLISLFVEQKGLTFDAFVIGGFYLVAVYIVGTLTQQRETALQARAKMTETLNQTYSETIRSLVAALDKRDSETGGHSERVTMVALSVAHQMHLDEVQVRQIHWGALLHDVGKIGIPDQILRKQGPLTDEEWKIMRSHPLSGFEILKGIPFLQPAMDVVLYHHEKYDGSGYPKGLAGNDIPLSARIFTIADAYDAMISDRPYRKAMPPAEVLAEIERCSNTQFDPQVVAGFKAAYALGWEANPHTRME